jgi:hypothetical protein
MLIELTGSTQRRPRPPDTAAWIPRGLQADATTRRSAGSVDRPGVLFCGGQDVFLRERYKIDLCVVPATSLEILARALARLEQNQS